MARIRSIKPEFWTDEEFAEAHTRDERLLYLALLNYAFDNWCGYYLPRSIKRESFPFDDDITVDDIERMMGRLEASGRVVFFTYDERKCFYLPKAEKHQVVNRPSPSPIAFDEASVIAHGVLTDDSSSRAGARPLPSFTSPNPSILRQVCDLIEAEYATFPTTRQREKLVILCDRYGESALDRIRYGITKAAASGKPNAGFAIGCAESASKQEIEGSTTSADPFAGVTLA